LRVRLLYLRIHSTFNFKPAVVDAFDCLYLHISLFIGFVLLLHLLSARHIDQRAKQIALVFVGIAN